jgi:dihydroorotate dehydrogenase electron transfer subunit
MKPSKSVFCGKIVSNSVLSDNCFLMILEVPSHFLGASPGQFVMIRIKNRKIPFLGRPFSIYSVYRNGNETFMEILYQTVGEGTKDISLLGAGDEVSITGPLGHGFDIMRDRKNVMLVAGGIGVAPVSFLAKRLKEYGGVEKITCYLGAGNEKLLAGLGRLEEMCSEVKISTDDGSRGYRGLVTDIFENDVRSCEQDKTIVYACGPRQMMERIATILKDSSIVCQVSAEEKMACGIGACLGCAVKMKSDNAGLRFARTCKDGPVFDIKDIEWE